jgi:hypothetical protein
MTSFTRATPTSNLNPICRAKVNSWLIQTTGFERLASPHRNAPLLETHLLENKNNGTGTEMGLIRKAIVLGGIFLALPSPPAQLVVGQPSLQSSTFATLSAAADTVADFKGFCERRPRACVTGQYLAYIIEGKAKYTARMLFEWANPAADTVQTADAPIQVRPNKLAPPLRLATLTEARPSKIEDLLRSTAE